MQDIEAIITDLYKLDPELAMHDTEVRIMVTGLLENQPRPVPDQVFVEKLRRTLLRAVPKPALTWQTVLWHLLPVGAVAAVVFVLAPSYTSIVPYQRVTPSTVETTPPMAGEEMAPASAKMVGGEGMSQPTTEGDVSAAAQSFSSTPVSGEIMAEEDISLMRTMMVEDVARSAAAPSDTIFVVEPVEVASVTIEYQSLLLPSFVVIKDVQTAKIVGVSDYLPPLEAGTAILTKIDLIPGGLYTAVLYRDTDGNEEFDPVLDVPVPNPVLGSWTEYVEVQFLVRE
jgi:hypothetical protein